MLEDPSCVTHVAKWASVPVSVTETVFVPWGMLPDSSS